MNNRPHFVFLSPVWLRTIHPHEHRAQADAPESEPLAQLRPFLQLTETQLRAILTNNDEYNRRVYSLAQRIWQVKREINEETAKQFLTRMRLASATPNSNDLP